MKTFYITGFQNGYQKYLENYFNKKFNSEEKIINFILTDEYEDILEQRVVNDNIKIIYLKTNINDIIENTKKTDKDLVELLEMYINDVSKFNVGRDNDFKYMADLYIEQGNMSLNDIIFKINDFIKKERSFEYEDYIIWE